VDKWAADAQDDPEVQARIANTSSIKIDPFSPSPGIQIGSGSAGAQ
jgi:hypothetical protein